MATITSEGPLTPDINTRPIVSARIDQPSQAQLIGLPAALLATAGSLVGTLTGEAPQTKFKLSEGSRAEVSSYSQGQGRNRLVGFKLIRPSRLGGQVIKTVDVAYEAGSDGYVSIRTHRIGPGGQITTRSNILILGPNGCLSQEATGRGLLTAKAFYDTALSIANTAANRALEGSLGGESPTAGNHIGTSTNLAIQAAIAARVTRIVRGPATP